ncbi:MAG: RyR domain-containing protein [Hyphomonadaceae bacterium]|nr:RyR domain-containing protein [Hyphomonadaceae bacterium]
MQNKDAVSPSKIEKIARTAHEAIKGWRLANGQESIPDWEDAPDWMVSATKDSVMMVLQDPNTSASKQHEQWMDKKLRDGWKQGPLKNPEAKTHPLLIPYEELPEVERMKDSLMNAVISALAEIQE